VDPGGPLMARAKASVRLRRRRRRLGIPAGRWWRGRRQGRRRRKRSEG